MQKRIGIRRGADGSGQLCDLPFRSKKHTWRRLNIPGVRTRRGPYTLNLCFRAAEEILQQRLDVRDGVLSMIQYGRNQIILKADPSEQDTPKPLIVGVSRAAAYDLPVQVDHNTISEMRRHEVRAGVPITFPEHFAGEKTAAGPFAWVSEFATGYAEVNLTAFQSTDHPDGIQRHVDMNDLNQGGEGGIWQEKYSSEVLRKLIEHQIRNVKRSGVVITPAFSAGDYLYNHTTNMPMLQCYRIPGLTLDADGNDYWMRNQKAFSERLPRQIPKKLIDIALQILTIIGYREKTHREANPVEYFCYALEDIQTVLTELQRDPHFLNLPEWTIVRLLIRSLQSILAAELGLDPQIRAKMMARIKSVEESLPADMGTMLEVISLFR